MHTAEDVFIQNFPNSKMIKNNPRGLIITHGTGKRVGGQPWSCASFLPVQAIGIPSSHSTICL